ncbi:MAG: hypothetical protein QI199_05570, partial [Candidatus Korarchaeota archaeon]|nr:hypothetical protein [Candidatus Korarchaeota archaeon]
MKTWSYAEGHVPRWLAYLLPLLPAILASMLYVWLLSRWGMLPGIDGPYYAVQVRALDATGSLKYPDPPLVFYLMLALYKASGDLFASVRLGASIPTALASAPLYVFARRLGASRVAALASSALFLLAPHSFRLVGDFMKNSAGLLWLSLMLLATHRHLRGEGCLAADALILGALYLAAGLTHILVYGFTLVFGLLSATAALMLGVPRRRVLAAAGAALASLAVFASAPWLQGGDLGKALRISEETASSLMSGGQARPHRRLFFPGATYLCLNWVSVLVLVAEAYLRRARRWDSAVLGGLAAATAVFSFPLIPWRFLMRFQLMGSAPLAVSLGAALGGLRRSRGALMAAAVV